MPAAPTNMPPASLSGDALIFISYRRVDSIDVTGRIYDQLVNRFGKGAVFKDVDNIPMGDEFRTVIGTAVRRCKVVLVIIGEKWLDVKDDDGGPRLANPDDYVRIEIETGLEHAYKVIPVLVQNSRMPTKKDLPDSIKRLVDRNGCWVRPDPDFHRDMDKLEQELERICRAATAPLAPASESVGGPAGPEGVRSVRLVPRSILFYWWPVWVVGFTLGLLSLFDYATLVELPGGRSVTKPEKGQYVIKLLPGDEVAEKSLDEAVKNAEGGPRLIDVGGSRNRGILFITTLLLVILITNVRLRGLWPVVVILAIVMVTIVLSLVEAWDNVLESMAALQVWANTGAYLVFSIIIFSAWLVAFLLVDPQIYAIVTPTEIRIKDQAGGHETAHATAGLTIAKQRDDFFRHWMLGLGSGDIVLRTAGPNGREIVLPNVLFAAQKLMLIEKMLRDRSVVFGD